MKGNRINWTEEMIQKLQEEFSYRFSRDIGNEMGISIRSVIRKARELGLEKQPGFLENNRSEISKRANENKPPNPNKGNKEFRIPGGEKFRFVPGQKRPPVDYGQITRKRNETIHKEKIRLKYGLPQKTKLKLKNIY